MDISVENLCEDTIGLWGLRRDFKEKMGTCHAEGLTAE